MKTFLHPATKTDIACSPTGVFPLIFCTTLLYLITQIHGLCLSELVHAEGLPMVSGFSTCASFVEEKHRQFVSQLALLLTPWIVTDAWSDRLCVLSAFLIQPLSVPGPIPLLFFFFVLFCSLLGSTWIPAANCDNLWWKIEVEFERKSKISL